MVLPYSYLVGEAMDWYYFALISFGFYIVQGLVLKYAAIKNCDRNLTTFYYTLTVAAISLPLLLFYGISIITILGLTVAFINGFFYFLSTTTRIESLKHIAASIVYPFIRLNNAVIIVILILFFGEKITFQNSIGIIISMFSLYLLSKGEKNEKGI